MPEPRDARPEDIEKILAAMRALEDDQLALEKAVAQALIHGASIRAVQEGTGLSPNTIQKYGARHGWPTAENRKNFNASKYDRRPR